MLKSVTIKNYALVEETEIRFDVGLNVVTGETGAGKSMVIGAIGALLGERTSVSVLREGAQKAAIEGVFAVEHLSVLQSCLIESDLASDDGLLILRREILASGRSRAFVNDTPATLDQTEKIAAFLVDLHGQHQHQSLLKVAEHIKFIDAFADLGEQCHRVANCFAQAEKARAAYEELLQEQKTRIEQRDYLAFQLDEIDNLNPQPDEESELLNEEKKLAHGTELLQSCDEVVNLLYENEASANDLLGAVVNRLQKLAEYDSALEKQTQEAESALIAVEEIAKSLQSYVHNIDVDPARLDEVRSRLSAFAGLKKKYSADFDGVLQKRDELQQSLQRIEAMDDLVSQALENWQIAIQEYESAAGDLSQARRAAAQEITRRVPEILAEIGMSGSRFEVKISPEFAEDGWCTVEGRKCKAFPNGYDRVEFFISANPGQPTRPLAKIASGGEISRIMLALKSLIAHADAVPVLIFDEIDIGISGRVAQSVGKLLRKLAESHQIVCITHLPQIAGAGSTHFLVEKSQRNGSTSTNVRKLAESERRRAIASLLAGEEISEAQLENAEALIEQARL